MMIDQVKNEIGCLDGREKMEIDRWIDEEAKVDLFCRMMGVPKNQVEPDGNEQIEIAPSFGGLNADHQNSGPPANRGRKPTLRSLNTLSR